MRKVMRSMLKNMVFGGLAVVALCLAGCMGGDKKKVASNDVVLLKINNKPAITKTEFYKELGTMVGQMDPALLPPDTKRKVLNDLARFETVVEAAKEDGIDKDPEFRKAYEEQKKRLKKVALVRFYDKKKFETIQVTDSEKKDHFDKNKSRFVKEQGGALVSGVKFNSRDKALSFYERAKKQDNADNFASVGKKEKDGNFREFGRVDKEVTAYNNNVPAEVRTAVTNLTKLPAVDVIKDGKDTWVIHVSDRKEAVFYGYEEIEDRIGNQLKVNKFMEQRNSMYESLKKKLNVEINEEFFKEQTPPATVASSDVEAGAGQAVPVEATKNNAGESA